MLFNSPLPSRGISALLACNTLLSTAAFAQAIDTNTLYVERERGIVSAQYSTADLRATFPIHDITTITPWTKDGTPTHFRGPLLGDILSKNQLNSVKSIEVYAYNDFMSEVENDEIAKFSPILAIEQECTDFDRQTKICGAAQQYRALTVKDGGPYYIIWPMDKLPSAYIPTRNSIWVWFVKTLRPTQ